MGFETLQKMGLKPGAAAGRIIVVTGAGEGIGRAVAQAFAWLGGSVVIAEISDQGLGTEHLIREAGGNALYVRTDISDPAQVSEMVRQAQASFGTVDILINNAILCPVASVIDMDVNLWDRVMAVNLRGPFLTCKSFLPGMLAANRGVIVNMVSLDAMTHLSAYIASKQGLVGLSQSLAAEVAGSEVYVIAFAPGFVATRGLKGAAEGLAPHIGLTPDQFLNMSLHPGYQGTMPAEDAAAATAYLALVLSKEYHGEVTNGFTVLEQAGVLSPALPQPAAQAAEPAVSTKSASWEQAVQAGERLQEIIAQTEAEVDKMPIFVRPIMRGNFKSKAGQSLQDWKRSASTLTSQLQCIAAGDLSVQETLQKDTPRWLVLLDKLEAYYLAMPAGAAAMTKDKEFLSMVEKQSAERVAVVRSVKDSLK